MQRPVGQGTKQGMSHHENEATGKGKRQRNTREGFQNAGSSLPRTEFQECPLKSSIFVCFVLFSLFLFAATKIILNDPLDNKWDFY